MILLLKTLVGLFMTIVGTALIGFLVLGWPSAIREVWKWVLKP